MLRYSEIGGRDDSVPNVVADVAERLLDGLEELPVRRVLYTADVFGECHLRVEFVDSVHEVPEEVVALVGPVGTYDLGEPLTRRTASDQVD